MVAVVAVVTVAVTMSTEMQINCVVVLERTHATFNEKAYRRGNEYNEHYTHTKHTH
jgi:hypothetical protein